MNQQKIGEFIMLLRKKNKLTQSELGALVFVARETIGKWERGVNLPDAHSLVLLANLFNVSINEILAGEYINDSNAEQINTLALNVVTSNNHQKIKTRRQIFIISITILAILFFLAYFLYNFNSMRVYLISGENETYSLSRSLIVISKQKSYIQIGSIINKETNANIVNQKEYKISVYYDQDNKQNLLFSSTGSDTLYTNLSDNETLDSQKLIAIIEHLYLVIEDKDTVSRIDIHARLDYINNHLFSLTPPSDDKASSIDSSESLDEAVNIQERSQEDVKIVGPVEYETASKKISLSATCFTKENICRVTFTTMWKNRPKTRSHDLIGIRLSDTFMLDEYYSSLANDYLEPDYSYHSPHELVSIFNMEKNDIKTLTQSFNVEYQGTVYASYQHARKEISLSKAQNFQFASTESGEVFDWNSSSMEKYYDDMPSIKLILKEEK